MTKVRTIGPDIEAGKPMPQAPDLEQAIIGAMLMESTAVDEVMDILRPECFYEPAHQLVYAAMARLRDRRDPIDILTVTEELRSAGDLATVGGPFYVSQLINKVASSANVRFHAMIVAQKHIGREIINASAEAARRAYDETNDVYDVLADTGERFMRLNEMGRARERDAAEVGREVVDSTEPDQALRTHFPDLDRVMRLEVGVNIVGARPGVGKTSFAISLAWRAVNAGTTVYFASLEMPDTSLVNRLICGECGVSVWKAKRGEHSDRDRDAMAKWYVENGDTLKRLIIDDTPSLDTASFAARLDRAKRKQGVGLVIVDYLQLLNVRGERFKDRFSRITAVSERLRIIAKETKLPVVALSQLNRASVAQGKPRRPSMSDLRESGQIEQDADTIMLLHREAYYDKAAPNDLDVIVAKNRDGEDGTVTLGFDATGARVVDKTFSAEPPTHVRNAEPF